MSIKLHLCGVLLCFALVGVTQAEPASSGQVPAGGYQLPPVATPESKDTTDNDGSKPIRVERIAFRGNKALRTSALQVVAAPYLGRELTARDIEELRIALTRQYTDRGY